MISRSIIDESILLALGYKPRVQTRIQSLDILLRQLRVLGLLPIFASTLLYGWYAGTAGVLLFFSSNNTVGCY